jgi:hypothetical protein
VARFSKRGEGELRQFGTAVGITALVLAGCSDNNTVSAKKAAAHDLKDPASSQFREIQSLARTTTEGGRIEFVCGEVNSKNGYGAYGGYSPFFVVVSHRTTKPVPAGAHAVLTVGHVQVASDDASSVSYVKKLCNAKDTIPLPAGGYDYMWSDPCGGADGDDTSESMIRYLSVKKFGKDLTCGLIDFGTQTQPNVYTMSTDDRAAYTLKLRSYMPVASYISAQSKLFQPLAEAREADDKKRPSYAPPP